MPLEYNPKDASDCWPAGEYEAVLKSVTDEISKSSNQPMEVWKLELSNSVGDEKTLREYVTAKAIFKAKQLAIALGQGKEFEAGKFHAENYVGSNVKVVLKVENNEEYGEQNRINGYKGSALAGTNPKNPRPAAGAFNGINRAAPPRQSVGAPQAPYGTEQTFKEDDIPF